ncbi:MAG: YbaB/EbfC family nucleoid-associated protein [Candidatus Eisenbacteria bacterium]
MKKLLKQAQQMQSRMAEMQAKLEESEFEASAGGGAATATVNGRLELLRLKIDPKAVDPEDVEMLEDLLLTAIRTAQQNAATTVQDEMGKLTGGMDLGNMF